MEIFGKFEIDFTNFGVTGVFADAEQVISDLLAQALGFEPSECEFIIIGSALFSTPKGVWVVEVEDIEFIG